LGVPSSDPSADREAVPQIIVALMSHTGLTVQVRIQRERELEELLPLHAFVVDDAEKEFVVNYAPEKSGQCIDPSASS
jgi:hypothetical protein